MLSIAEILAESPRGDFAVQQGRTVNGTVTGAEDKQPIPGVNILIKGTVSGSQTDSEGNFSVQVHDDQAILVFSAIGYVTQEIQVSGRNIINVNLVVDIRTLEEIVVVGYGTQGLEYA